MQELCSAQDARIECLPDFVSVVASLSSLQRADYFHDPLFYYRGQSNCDYELTPTLGRYVNRETKNQFALFEREIIHKVQCEYPQQFPLGLQPFALLTELQHLGIPTRLLDITSNALVALYFAVCSSADKDGEVVVFKVDGIHTGLEPVINAIASTYSISHCGMPYANFFKAANLGHPSYRISRVGPMMAETLLKKRYFVQPQLQSLRQKVQSSAFILFTNASIVDEHGDECGIGDRILPIEKQPNEILQRIIIPANAKMNMLSELRFFGIDDIHLFPENIDNGCKKITSHFAERLSSNDKCLHDMIG